jgi:hypothetical protein
MDNSLTPDSQTVLKTVVMSGSIRGFELQERTGLEVKKLIEATSSLVRRDYITASGPISPETFERVRFAPLCSGFENAPA